MNFFEVDHTTLQTKGSDYRNNRLVHTWKLFSCRHAGKCCSKAWAIIPGFRQLYLRHVVEVLVGEQWIQKQKRIQDFPDLGAPTLEVGDILFDKIFAENCMKMKEIGPREGRETLRLGGGGVTKNLCGLLR